MLARTMRVWRFLFLAGLLVVMAGCASVPRQSFNVDANKDIKRIGLIEPAFGGDYTIQNFGHPGGAFGLVGGLIAAAHMQSQTNEFTLLVKASSTQYDIVAHMKTALKSNLEAAGYQVVEVKAPADRKAWLEKYEGLEPAVDAYVDPVIVYSGFFTASVVSDYLPAMRLGVRLVKRGSSEILYSDFVAYGYQLKGSEVASIPADPKYRFADFDALKAKPDLARASLREGVDKVARQVGSDLRGLPATQVSMQ